MIIMKQFSVKWKASKKPGKQRKYRIHAPLHIRHKMVSATLSKELRKSYNKRSLPIKKDDAVSIMRGEHRGRKGKVTEVNLKEMKIKVEGITAKKANGETSQIYLDPSNVMITTLNMEDMKRRQFVKRKEAKEKK